MFKSILAVAATVSVLGVASQAPANDLSAPPSRAVSSAGVNFHDRAAVGAFYGQLNRAAWAVCDTYAANSRVTQGDRACAEAALANAVRKVDRPMLTVVYDTAHGRERGEPALQATR